MVHQCCIPDFMGKYLSCYILKFHFFCIEFWHQFTVFFCFMCYNFRQCATSNVHFKSVWGLIKRWISHMSIIVKLYVCDFTYKYDSNFIVAYLLYLFSWLNYPVQVTGSHLSYFSLIFTMCLMNIYFFFVQEKHFYDLKVIFGKMYFCMAF